MSRLSLLDLAFFLTESEESPKHVAGLAIFDPGKAGLRMSPRDLLKVMKDVPPAPPFNQKLKYVGHCFRLIV